MWRRSDTPHGFSRNFVLTDGFECASVAGRDEQGDEDDGRQRDAVTPPDVRRRGDGFQTLRAVGQALGISDNDADNLRKAERCDCEVVAAQTQAGQTDEKRQCCRQQAADDERNAERQGQRVERRDERLKHEDGFLFGDGDGQQRNGIRADCHKARMTEGKDARKAVDQIHGQGEDDIDGAQPCDADDIFAGIAFDIEQHAAEQSQQQAGQDDRAFLYFAIAYTFSVVFSPSRPVGLTSSTRISTTNANASR